MRNMPPGVVFMSVTGAVIAAVRMMVGCAEAMRLMGLMSSMAAGMAPLCGSMIGSMGVADTMLT